MSFDLHRLHDIKIEVQILIHFQPTLLVLCLLKAPEKYGFRIIPRSIYLSGILARNGFHKSSVSLSRYLNVFCIITSSHQASTC